MKLFFLWLLEAFKVLNVWLMGKAVRDKTKKERLKKIYEDLEKADTQLEIESAFNNANSVWWMP